MTSACLSRSMHEVQRLQSSLDAWRENAGLRELFGSQLIRLLSLASVSASSSCFRPTVCTRPVPKELLQAVAVRGTVAAS